MAKSPSKLEIAKLEISEISTKVQAVRSDFIFASGQSYKAYFEIQLKPLYNLEGNAIKIDLRVDIGFEHESGDHPKVGEFAFEFFYNYSSLSSLLMEDNELDPEIFLVCANISYSTLRGIIYTKSANTCLEKVLLPIVTGAELMKGMHRKS
jgi:hypothetical protein